MVKVIDYGPILKRRKIYYKVNCIHCNALLTFEYGDIWWENVPSGYGRVECPVCRTKTFFDKCDEFRLVPSLELVDNATYDNAYQDTSKHTLNMLALEKEDKV